jgi:hypothetical protein
MGTGGVLSSLDVGSAAVLSIVSFLKLSFTATTLSVLSFV